MTNWVTVKIKEPVRDEAREDSRTYTEVMRDGLEDGSSASGDIDAEAIAERIKKALGWGEGDTHTTATLPRETYELEDGQTWQDVLDEATPDDEIDELTREVRKAQELAEQARDAAQRVEEGMGR